jgi:16S rRNA (cytosine967-C5)-methyltransferase
VALPVSQNPRQLALVALRSIHNGAFADVAVDRVLQSDRELAGRDRGLVTELVYGCVRRQRSLDYLIDRFATKTAAQQPPDLRLILHLGLYQLAYLTHIPDSAAVNTTVELAKQNGLAGLGGFVNGLLRQYLRQVTPPPEDSPLETVVAASTESSRPSFNVSDHVFASLATQVGVQYSYPDWIVQVWLDQFGLAATEQLCEWMNQPPPIDLRINTQRTDLATVEAALQAAGISTQRLPHLPQALRLQQAGAIQNLPGFQAGWWMVQDSSAQLVSYLVDPQPGEVVVDACAAPGGKTLHLAELMGDRGTVWACDSASRLKKIQQNCDRLGLQSIQLCPGDSRELTQFQGMCDRVLVDAPCSGLGTLNRHADARWRQTPASVSELAQLQLALLTQAATWVKPHGSLVYATCTLHPTENEGVLHNFLTQHPTWQIEPPAPNSPVAPFATASGWSKILPHQHQMDGFFMVKLKQKS